MTERPILFSGAMVRAILDGRKTQTRRVAVPKRSCIDFIGGGPKGGPDWNDPACWGFEDANTGFWWALRGDEQCHQLPCPHGRPGDRLWVRETHLNWWKLDEANTDGPRVFSHVAAYAADGYELEPGEKWIPSIHMLRAASRITLEITGVRVERLQNISEADALDEGMSPLDSGRFYCGEDDDGAVTSKSPVTAYAWLWNSLNAARGQGWDANPWVWVVEFRRVAP